MQLQLLSCDAPKPDKRAIANCLVEYAGMDTYTAQEMTAILLEGDAIDIEVEDNSSNSAMRMLRKLDIDYEILED